MTSPWRACLFILVSGCAPTAKQLPRKAVTSTPAASVTSVAALAGELLETHCSQCHDDESSGRPRFGRGVPIDPTQALRAAALIAADRMPPPPATLDEPVRRRVLDVLCRVGAKDPSACMRAYGPLTTPFVRTPLELMRAVDSIAPAGPRSAPVEDMMTQLVPGTTRAFRQNVSFEALIVLLAASRCPAPTGATETAAAFERCVAAILDDRLARLSAPDHEPHGKD